MIIDWITFLSVKSNSNKSIKFSSHLEISQPINVQWYDYDRNISSTFYESKKILACSIKREKVKLKKKTGDVEKVYFLKLQHHLTQKLIRRVREQQSCLWRTLYQMDFLKRYVSKRILDKQFVKKSWINEGGEAWSNLLLAFALQFLFVCYLRLRSSS